MKLRVTIFLLAFLFFVPNLASADIMNSNQHQVQRCLKIVNIDKFPDLALVGFYTGVMLENNKNYIAYQVKNNECLTKGYKFNKLNLYWVTQKKFASLNLNNLILNTKKVASGGWDAKGNVTYYDVYSPKNLELLTENIESGNSVVDNTDHLIKETLEYSLLKNSDGNLSLYKSKRITDYNDGSQQKIETFQTSGDIINSSSTPVNLPEEKQVKKNGFWHSILCFFKIFSSDSCR